MYKLALVGRDISHSKSKLIYENILNESVDYALYDYDLAHLIPSLETLFASKLDGLSVTSPYKAHFIKQVYIENKIIKELGIINCIKKTSSGFEATNTDFLAVKEILNKDLVSSMNVVILGDGKMAKVCKEILKQKGTSYKQYCRKTCGDISKLDLSAIKKLYVINTCSRSFNFNGSVSRDCVFWDMNYSHLIHEKNLIKLCDYKDGLKLLELQGLYAVNFWGL